jgi:hypothetical protein
MYYSLLYINREGSTNYLGNYYIKLTVTLKKNSGFLKGESISDSIEDQLLKSRYINLLKSKT